MAQNSTWDLIKAVPEPKNGRLSLSYVLGVANKLSIQKMVGSCKLAKCVSLLITTLLMAAFTPRPCEAAPAWLIQERC